MTWADILGACFRDAAIAAEGARPHIDRLRRVSIALERYNLRDRPLSMIPRIDPRLLWSAWLEGSTLALAWGMR